VGHTGAGKSSIAKLITRFYEFQGGEILVDGHDIRDPRPGPIPAADWAGAAGTPSCSTARCATTSNTACPRPPTSEWSGPPNQIDNGDWLKALPHGLDTEVGERGSNLSMGQRQLVALARVILKDPAIFILDEATASVDPFTEAQIQEGHGYDHGAEHGRCHCPPPLHREKRRPHHRHGERPASSKKGPTSSC
jgi:ATP-binding cassette, subfamily B, bacterial